MTPLLLSPQRHVVPPPSQSVALRRPRRNWGRLSNAVQRIREFVTANPELRSSSKTSFFRPSLRSATLARRIKTPEGGSPPAKPGPGGVHHDRKRPKPHVPALATPSCRLSITVPPSPPPPPPSRGTRVARIQNEPVSVKTGGGPGPPGGGSRRPPLGVSGTPPTGGGGAPPLAPGQGGYPPTPPSQKFNRQSVISSLACLV